MKQYTIYSIPNNSYSLSGGGNKSYTLKKIIFAMGVCLSTLLASCASENLKAPCPDYGKHCDTTPVNSWDTSTV